MTSRLLDRMTNRRTLLRGIGVGGLGLVGAALIGCSDDDDDDEDEATATATATAAAATGTTEATATSSEVSVPAEDADFDLGAATQFDLVEGWHKGDDVVYYDFGMRSPLTSTGAVGLAPIWAFITGLDADGNPQFVEGQHNVIDAVPADAGYSDLWEVSLVTVPAGYEADSIRSKADLDAAGEG